ncbi:hypothetical protein E4U37_005716 [Claviceps purpurea]|nr:hypothetical protein E4U37_005716 [Claviceps purpurea]
MIDEMKAADPKVDKFPYIEFCQHGICWRIEREKWQPGRYQGIGGQGPQGHSDGAQEKSEFAVEGP